MKFDFSNQVVLITGGTSGIGLSTACMFLEAGASVAVVGTDEQKGITAVRELASSVRLPVFVRGDVSKVQECERVVREVTAQFGRLDVLVNSAGNYLEKPLEDMAESEFDLVLGVNLKGTYFMSKFALPVLKRNRGSIVNLSSDAGINGNVHCTAYCAAKGAVTLFTKSLALEAAPFGVRVNCVCPGDIATPMVDRQLAVFPDPKEQRRLMESLYPLGRIGMPEEVASVILFLASESASFVTGAAWCVDGGLTSV